MIRLPGLAHITGRGIWLAALVTLTLAGGAHASNLVFSKPDGNIWLANPDGSGLYQVTLDGSAANPYSSPTQADDGTIEAQRGSGAGTQLDRMTQNGTLLNAPFTTAAPNGPFDATIAHDASKVSYWAITGVNSCYPFFCPGTASSVQVSYADHYVDPSTFNPNVGGWSSFQYPAWMGNSRQLLFADNGTLWYYDLGQSQPVEWRYWSDFSNTVTQGYGSWIEGAVSPDGTRLATVSGEDNAGRYVIQIFSGTQDIRSGDLTGYTPTVSPCEIPAPDGSNGTNGSYPGQYIYFDSLSWSPDGQSLAFEYHGAIYVASFGSLTDCSQITVRQVIASGCDPNWGLAPISPQTRPGPPPPPPPSHHRAPATVTRTGSATTATAHGSAVSIAVPVLIACPAGVRCVVRSS